MESSFAIGCHDSGVNYVYVLSISPGTMIGLLFITPHGNKEGFG